MNATHEMASSFFFRLSFALAASSTLAACSGTDNPSATPAARADAGADSGAATEPDFACLPDCYRQAFETCRPIGTCVVEVAPGSTVGRIEDWVCFSNDMRTHTTGTMQGGSTSIATDISTVAGICRHLELTAGAAGSFYTMKDVNGATLASAAITSYPGITIACANMQEQKQLDRTTPCGRAALLEITNAAGDDAPPSCTLGSCPH